MAHQSLYRRYRPRNFAEVKGQDHVVTALRNAVADDSAGHAYMFSGPRGTGKTSSARIFAKALNCTAPVGGEPCCECESCLSMEAGTSFDLFELDAASHRSVEHMRDLVDRTMVVSPGRTKVYILDEVHMLTPAASNTLLKTLEEPPGHVRFMLATTDPQKVLPTIRSRTQHFEFRLLSVDELTEQARWVSKEAELAVDDTAIAYAVKRGRGSVRDMLSALDQVVASGGVYERSEPVDDLFSALGGESQGAALIAVADAIARGHDPRVLAEAFIAEVREAFFLSVGADTPNLVDADRERLGEWAQRLGSAGLSRAMEHVGSALVDMRSAADPRVPLEVALIQLTASEKRPAARSEEPSGQARQGTGRAAPAAGAELADLRSRVERLETARRTENSTVGTTVSAGGTAGSTTGEASQAQMKPAAEPTEEISPQPQDPQPRDLARSEPRDRSGSAGKAAEARSELRRSSRAKPPPPPPPPRRSRDARPAGSKPPEPQAPKANSGHADANPKAETEVPTKRGNEAPVDRGDAASSETATGGPPPVSKSIDDSIRKPAPGGPPGATTGAPPDRDALVMAFGDRVVPQLKGVAKAIFSQGRFVSVEGDKAVFAVENAPTRERAERYRSDVETLLGAEFSTAIALQLVIDGEEPRSRPEAAGTRRPAPSPAAQEPGASEDDDEGVSPSNRAENDGPAARGDDPADGSTGSGTPVAGADADDAPEAEEAEEAEIMARVSEFEDADVQTSSVDRLTAAFPGAELIEPEETS